MFKSETSINVRYAETDQMSVVYHANYLIWMDVARTQLIKDLGFDYKGMEDSGFLAPVTNVDVHYLRPFRFGDTARIVSWIDSYDGIRLTYAYEMYNGETLAIKSTSSHAIVKKESFRPVSLRKSFPDWHQAYEEAKRK